MGSSNREQVTFRVEGLNRLVRDLQAFGVEVDDLKGAFTKIALTAAEDYKRFVPVRSGALAGDFRASKTKNKARLMVGRVRIPYAQANNYGWGPKSQAWKHGNYASKNTIGSFAGTSFVAQGDEVLEPKVMQLLENELNRLIRRKGY